MKSSSTSNEGGQSPSALALGNSDRDVTTARATVQEKREPPGAFNFGNKSASLKCSTFCDNGEENQSQSNKACRALTDHLVHRRGRTIGAARPNRDIEKAFAAAQTNNLPTSAMLCASACNSSGNSRTLAQACDDKNSTVSHQRPPTSTPSQKKNTMSQGVKAALVQGRGQTRTECHEG